MIERTLKSGDAFDCDVNGDGKYNSDTERFYYVSDYYNTTTKEFENDVAVLIYYNNVSNGKPSNSMLFAYDSSNQNWHGPRTAIEQLPSTSEWRNVSLKNSTRAILNENGGNTTKEGPLPSNFSYAGYSARLLTTQEINKACGITVGKYTKGELDSCNYLMENTKYSNASIGNYGYWFENPHSSSSSAHAWFAGGSDRCAASVPVSDTGRGVRPAIEVPKSYIEY